jgi:hypothetical protein
LRQKLTNLMESWSWELDKEDYGDEDISGLKEDFEKEIKNGKKWKGVVKRAQAMTIMAVVCCWLPSSKTERAQQTYSWGWWPVEESGES